MSTRFRTVALVGRHNTEGLGETLGAIVGLLRARGLQVLVDVETGRVLPGADVTTCPDFDTLGRDADLAIAVGGDGTMLGLARSLARHEIPLLGINHGRLGFVTDIPLDAWQPALEAILEGAWTSEDRTLLTARVLRHGQQIWSALAMNDVVVSRSSRAGMIEVEVHVNDTWMYTQRADGLIVATPTGSTAYALSANGPILHPGLAGLVLVPVAPQALSNRPIALPDSASIRIRVVDGREPRVAGDMQVFSDLQKDDDILIERAPYRAHFLHPVGYSYFATLRSKLNWHEMPILSRPGSDR